MITAQDLIDQFQLERLPVEGILFRQIYRSPDTIADVAASGRYARDKPAGTCILAMFTDDPDSFSVMHRLATDEIWHFYLGDPIEMLLLHPDGRGERVTLGHDFAGGQRVQFVVPRRVWMGARLIPGGAWALFGNTMAPGFTSADFEGAERAALIGQYPAEAEMIARLTRPDGETRMPKGY
jgi:predicted cupin superfamily sugar epimerase